MKRDTKIIERHETSAGTVTAIHSIHVEGPSDGVAVVDQALVSHALGRRGGMMPVEPPTVTSVTDFSDEMRAA